MANRLWFGTSVNLQGDGTSTVTTVSLEDLRDFNGRVPFPASISAADVQDGAVSGPTLVTATAVAISGGRKIQITFSEPLQNGAFYQVLNVRLFLET